jgi:hypothetical protein
MRGTCPPVCESRRYVGILRHPHHADCRSCLPRSCDPLRFREFRLILIHYGMKKWLLFLCFDFSRQAGLRRVPAGSAAGPVLSFQAKHFGRRYRGRMPERRWRAAATGGSGAPKCLAVFFQIKNPCNGKKTIALRFCHDYITSITIRTHSAMR